VRQLKGLSRCDVVVPRRPRLFVTNQLRKEPDAGRIERKPRRPLNRGNSMKYIFLIFLLLLPGLCAAANINGANGTFTGTVSANAVSAKTVNGIVYAAPQSGADWCAKVAAADTALGSATGVIMVGPGSVPNACASMFQLSANHSLWFLDAGPYVVSDTLKVPTSSFVRGTGGGPGELPAPLPLTGTVIQAIPAPSIGTAVPPKTFPPSTPVILFRGTAHSSLEGVSIDCQNIPGCIGLQNDSDNNLESSPNRLESSLNRFENLTIKGAHLGFVCGSPGTGSFSNQSDTWTLSQFLIYGNPADTSGEGIHLNSSNCNAWEIASGNIQLVNIGIHQVNSNGQAIIKFVNAGSPVGSAPVFMQFDPGVVQVPEMTDVECEGGGWTGGCIVDSSNNGTAGSPTFIGNQLNGNQSTFLGNDQITDIGSNTSTTTGFVCGSSAPSSPALLMHHVIAINTSNWKRSAGCELSSWNQGVLQTQQVAVTNGNGVQYCTGSFATCAKITNDTGGGINSGVCT
jgi:hypothetical protein